MCVTFPGYFFIYTLIDKVLTRQTETGYNYKQDCQETVKMMM
jgi:hypothetical protein